MTLPTQSQVNMAVRYTTTIIGTLIAVLGLQNHGIYLDPIKAAIEALGMFVNALLVLIAAATPLWMMWKGYKAASPIGQAKSLEAQGNIVVGSAEMAAATPSNPNILSRDEVQVVQVPK
jgi:hypothetical protein